jgi:hypothetical protein
LQLHLIHTTVIVNSSIEERMSSILIVVGNPNNLITGYREEGKQPAGLLITPDSGIQ